MIKIRSEADRKYTFFGRFIFAAFFPEPGKKKAAFPVQNAAFDKAAKIFQTDHPGISFDAAAAQTAYDGLDCTQNVVMGENGVDGKTGATFSSKALFAAINDCVNCYNELA